MNNPCTSLRYRKMGLTSLHDFVDLWHLYICRSLLGHSTFLLSLHSCEMGLTKPTRLLRFVTFVHLPFSVRSLNLFCRFTHVFEAHFVEEFYKWIWALDLVRARLYRSWVYMISAVICCRFVEFDTSVICHVFMHCFGSFLLQAMFLSLQVSAFQTSSRVRVASVIPSAVTDLQY